MVAFIIKMNIWCEQFQNYWIMSVDNSCSYLAIDLLYYFRLIFVKHIDFVNFYHGKSFYFVIITNWYHCVDISYWLTWLQIMIDWFDKIQLMRQYEDSE